jgi:CHAT domain-containing protein/lipopolysaccharide biosynthesis regulator YciM
MIRLFSGGVVMAHQFQQPSGLRRSSLLTDHHNFTLFTCLLLLPGLTVSGHAHRRIEQSIGAFAQSAQRSDGASNSAKNEQDVRTLEPGKPIERELAGGQSHAYQITLAEGQFLNVTIEQRGIDVVVKLLGPDGKQIVEFDSEITKQGQETVTQVAEVAGNYRLNVQAKQQRAPAGGYEIRLQELRVANEKDRALQQARELNAESVRLYRTGKYDQARPLAEHALEIRQKELGLEHPNVADSLNGLAILFSMKGDYAKAIPLHRRALEIREKALGPEHPDVAATLHNLANLSRNTGDFTGAESFYQRALNVRTKALGSEHPGLIPSLTNLGSLYRAKGDYVKAEPLLQSALTIGEKTLGMEATEIAYPLNDFADLYRDKGDYTRAELLYRRALSIQEKALGMEHPELARSIDSLAGLYYNKGDYAKAVQLLQRALSIGEKTLGTEDPGVAASIHNLAITYYEMGDYDKAEPLFQRTLSISEKALGREHPGVAATLNGLANLYYKKGDYTKAEPLYQRALNINEKKLGPGSPQVADLFNNFANLYHNKGDYAKAITFHQRALDSFEKTFGPDHPRVAGSLDNLARTYAANGDIAQAITAQTRASAISERNLTLNTATGSERQKLAYLATMWKQSNQIVSMHVQVALHDPAARNLAATTILRRKGRVLDMMSDILGALRRRSGEHDRILLDKLSNTRSLLASLMIRGPGRSSLVQFQAETKRFREQIENIEAEMSDRSAEFRTQSRPINLGDVRASIPQDAILVEFFSYHPENVKSGAWEPPRYIAYAFGHQGEPAWVELGEAQEIERAVNALRQALRSPNRADAKQLARALDEKVMRPVRKLLGDTRNVLLSPDGALNLIPFGALVDEQNHYLIENYSFTYLTSGRDLLRLQAPTSSRQEPMVVANPQFDLRESAIASNQPTNQDTEARRSIDFTQKSFNPLPSTAVEARAIGAILPGAKVLTGAQATESAIKQVSGPSILHVATHGFFLADQKPGIANTSPGLEERQGLFSEDPLLRSGLILAGANQRQSGAGEDGILTALEVAGIDLWGTKLVALSACDTGLGEVKNGDGVYGLRRALVLAGAESQVMSLWEVADKATRELMVGYYTGLKQGEGRSEALRNVQLKMLRSRERRHPYFWAGFIQSGEWANLEGKR